MHTDRALPDDVLEKIFAFVEREAGRDAPLSPKDEATVRLLLATDAEAQAYADDLRTTNAGLDDLLADVSAVEVPERLVEMIRAHGKSETEAAGGEASTTVVPFSPRSAPARQRYYGPLAVAASLVALLSAGAGFSLYQSNDALRNVVATVQDKRSVLDRELVGLRSEAGDLSDQLATARKDLVGLRTELSTALNARDAATFELEKVNAELAGVRSTGARVAEQLAALDQETRQYATQRSEELDRVAGLEADLRAAKDAKELADAEVERFHVRLAELTSHTVDLDQTVAHLEEEAARISTERDASQRELDVTQAALTDMQQQVAELSAMRGTLVAVLQSRDLDLVEQRTALKTAEEQLAEVTRDRNLLADKDERNRARVIALEGDLNSTRAAVANLDVQTEELRAKGSWLAQVAGYHLGYAGDPREVEITAEQERASGALTKWLSRHLGRDIAVPNLAGDGMTFVGGRLFFVNGQPVGQIAYHDREGRLTGFCIKPNPSNTEASLIHQQHDEGLEMISWQDQNLQYVLVGFEDFETLQPIAERLEAIYGKDI